MVSFEFLGLPFTSDEKTIVIKNSGVEHFPSIKDKDGVAYFSKSAYFSVPFQAGYFKNGCMVLTLSFLIDKKSAEDRALLSIDGLPVNLNLRFSEQGYRIETRLDCKPANQSFLSMDTVSKDEWHELVLYLLDGECFLTLDGKVQGRRVFPGEFDFGKPVQIYIGKRINKSVSGGFYGYVDKLTFADTLTEEQDSLAVSLADDGLGEIESKYEQLISKGVETGELVNQKVILNPDFKCFYAKYENGVIFRSPSYGCVWLSSGLMEGYLNNLNTKPIGLPMADETVSTEYGVTYCFCEAGGLFLSNDSCYYLPADFLTEYAEKGLLASGYGLPSSQTEELIVSTKTDEKVLTYQNFTNAVFIKRCRANEQAPLIILPRWVAERLFSNISDWGFPTDYVEGYRGNIRGDYSVKHYVMANYLFTDNGVVCCNVIQKEDGTRYDAFIPDPDIFAYFMDQMGLNSKAAEPFGPYKCITGPRKVTAKGTVYHDCAEGVLVYYSKDSEKNEKKIYGFTYIKITLSQISAAKIDDGWFDDTPELYIEVTSYRNGKEVYPKKRWPEYSARKHGGSTLRIIYEGDVVTEEHKEGHNVFYTFPRIHGADKLHMKIHPCDYDEVTKNDALGSFEINLDIESGWGILSDFLTEEDRKDRVDTKSELNVDYIGMYLTSSYGDNRGGRKNIQLNFSISRGEIEYDLDSYFRKYGYWSVDNFKTKEPVSHDLFNRTFHANTNHWYDWILHFWDKVWYEAAKSDSYNGSGGHCFGLSTEALFCLKGSGNFTMPLNDLKLFSQSKEQKLASSGINPYADGAGIYIADSSELNTGFFQTIREKHLYQLGWAHINMVVDKAINGSLFNPATAFSDIADVLKKDKYCLVNLFGGSEAHSVLAYGEKVVAGKQRILIADCNHPWWEDKSEKDGSYLILNEEIPPKVELHYSLAGTDNSDETYNCCYPTRYKILAGNPRVPSWFELTAFAIRRIIQIPEFVNRNMTEFLYVVSMGDAEISVSDTDSKNGSFQIPAFSATIPAGNQLLRLMVAPKETAEIRISGKEGENFNVFVGGRTKIFRASGTVRKEATVLDAKRLGKKNGALRSRASKGIALRSISPASEKSDLEIAELSTVAAPYGKGAKLNDRYDKSKQPPAPEARYYLNMRRQKNGKFEVHSERCPFMDRIKSTEYLGCHTSAKDALEIARDHKDKVDGCHFCCKSFSTD